ncbi:MAG: DUF1972 domain-containing protein [Oscillospiraceae bacterium]|nr:DUF1972 domain-containing protein [Oscillospiraceae bacterium]
MQHVFIAGAKSLGAYGGYETFVNKLTEYHKNENNIQYHIACKSGGYGSMDKEMLSRAYKIMDGEYIYNNAHCFTINVPDIGPAGAICYDLMALEYFCRYIKENNISKPVVYVLACRIGPFASYYRKRIHQLGGRFYINPDGHEWKRSKWPLPVKMYWKLSEKLMVRNADLVVCDSINIEEYIKERYSRFKPRTTYIAYGAEIRKSTLDDTDASLLKWYEINGVKPGNYYLIVGRFVPENNYETMIREFMACDSLRDLVIITNENKSLYSYLETKLMFSKDKRIKFAGTVYDTELLMKIRENAWGYIHGHEVGGTNPSLLEALSSTAVNLVYDIGFNSEVALNSALYWDKSEGCLAHLVHKADRLSMVEIAELERAAKERISEFYSWEYISDKYKQLFTSDNENLLQWVMN